MSTLNTLFSGGVKSVQRGTLSFSANGTEASVIINVAAVNPNRAVLIETGWTSSAASSTPNSAATQPRIELINATQIRATRNNQNTYVGPSMICWQLVEYY